MAIDAFLQQLKKRYDELGPTTFWKELALRGPDFCHAFFFSLPREPAVWEDIGTKLTHEIVPEMRQGWWLRGTGLYAIWCHITTILKPLDDVALGNLTAGDWEGTDYVLLYLGVLYAFIAAVEEWSGADGGSQWRRRFGLRDQPVRPRADDW